MESLVWRKISCVYHIESERSTGATSELSEDVSNSITGKDEVPAHML